MKKHSRIRLYMLFVFLMINGIGCTSFYANKARQAAVSNNYDEWQRQWKKRLPFNEKEKLAFRLQGLEILASFMKLKEKALKSNSFSDAQKVALNLPQVYSFMKQCDAGFAGVVSDNPYLLNLDEARRSAPCLPSMVEARLAVGSNNYEEAVKKCRDCCPTENQTQEITSLCKEVITEVLKNVFSPVREYGDAGEYIKQSEVIADIKKFLGAQNLDISNVKCPGDLGIQFSSYQQYLDDVRQKNVATLEKKARTWLSQKNYEDAKNASMHALQIAIGADRSRLDILLQTIVETGVKDYRDGVKKLIEKGDYNIAEALLLKASVLDPTLNTKEELTRVRADKNEKQGRDLMAEANDCYSKKQFLCAYEKAKQALNYLLDASQAEQLLMDASNAQGNWHIEQGNSFWAKGNLGAAEAEFEKAKIFLSNPQKAEDLRLKVRDARGNQLLEKGKRLWDAGDYNGAIAAFEAATEFLLNPQEAITWANQVKDAQGRNFLRMCRSERERGNCKTAVEFAQEARPLLSSPKEADYDLKISMECAVRRVAIILANNTSDVSLINDRTGFLGEVQKVLAANTSDYFKVLDAHLLPTNGTPSDIARTAGADYALVIQLSNLNYNKQIDNGKASTVCTSTQDRNILLGYDIYGRAVYTIVRDYTYTSMTKYFDRADAKVTVQAYLLEIKSGQSTLSKNEIVSGEWNQEAWRSDTAAKYLRYCPACCFTNSQEVTSFLPQSYFSKDRKLPVAGDLLLGKILDTVLGWAKDYGIELKKQY